VRPVFKSVDAYIAAQPPEVQERLRRIRAAIRKAAPDAVEAIKYAIPAYVWNGNLIYFAAYRNHIGVYPAPRKHPDLADELSKYEGGKGTVQFPHDEPIPMRLVTKMVKVRLAENAAKGTSRKK
jgi:uncharacterized protein YdhG (YjbR/CyaY superfamily)